jgi:hypothetical protein
MFEEFDEHVERTRTCPSSSSSSFEFVGTLLSIITIESISYSIPSVLEIKDPFILSTSAESCKLFFLQIVNRNLYASLIANAIHYETEVNLYYNEHIN